MWRRAAWWVGAAALISCTVALREAQLPYCNDDPAIADNDLVIVSTLDGRLTAFSAEGGSKAWDLKTAPLLNSNLHHVELTSGGKWVRLVPSLSGSLYRLSGDTLEPLPLNAEQLLSSSFKYSEDLVIAGSRETVWAGVEASSGRVVYRCGSAGCSSEAQTSRDLLVLRHSANTVRALDPRTGMERWNFSVAEHQLSLSESSACASAEANDVELSVALVLPDGVVGVRRADMPGTMLWQHQLAAPVADVWRLKRGVLRRIDVMWSATELPTVAPPSLYIGVHDQQLYVQEGSSYAEKVQSMTAIAPLPWRPKPARPMIDGPNTALQQLGEKETGALALMSLYAKNAQKLGNHGYFLYADDPTCDKTTNVSEDELIDTDARDVPALDPPPASHHHVHVHVYSLWFWWKEVLLIAISSALLMNLMIWPRFFAPKFRPRTPLPINQEYIVVERHYDRPPPPPPPPALPPADYSSRYACDFTPLRCLGRGGFGVVFECRNNIDHCSYAVKRITLPKRERKRERVLREVRALAKLEHENIVRYFNAWLEEPPMGWQERQDSQWTRELDVSLSITEDVTSLKTPLTHTSMSTHKVDSIMLNLQRPEWENIPFENSEHFSKRHRSLSCNDSFSIVFSENGERSHNSAERSHKLGELSHTGGGDNNDDSFIVFANSEDLNHNSQGYSGDATINNKHLEKVKECESGVSKPGKKKGHRRHWSLDLCVKSSAGEGSSTGASKMYLYIQMQLCMRDSLHDWLRQHPRHRDRRDKVTSLFSQIVSAVEYVHLAGLIHRDLKPSNIFFAPDGRVKVGDFGLVTAMSDSSQDGDEAPPQAFNAHARHTYKVGTHLYMSPEQLRGAPYNFKVDIYSLGLILFELLEPFSTECERVACLLRLREGQIHDAFRERLPKETELLQLMLSPQPDARPTATGVLADTRWRQPPEPSN